MGAEKKTCFVVMGFGEKVDFQTARKLNLDASYHNMIKPAVEEAGLRCVRADEIVHAGVIDVPMYEHLLNADVVIADLSTYNPNAFYELGVRHALRPYTTIVIAEDKLNYPFDVNHIRIRRYRHLGDDIGVGDARKFIAELKEALGDILASQKNDSPVYQFLDGLTPPELKRLAEDVAAQAAQTPQAGQATRGRQITRGGAAPRAAAPPPRADVTLGMLMHQADEAQKRSDFQTARARLADARALKPEDPYVIRRLAFATYKSGQPTPKEALEEARALLETLNPLTSTDTETLGLWGSVHKRLWELTGEAEHLSEALRGTEGGFYLRRDRYSGINLAFLLNVRAARAESRAEAVADFVQARRVRRKVLASCEAALAGKGLRPEQKYWLLATSAEALLGLGEEEAARRKYDEAFALAPAEWMKATTREQMENLRRLLADSPLKYVREDGE